MEQIELFTMATGPYVAYLDNFVHSVGNFFPNKNKTLHIFVDIDSVEEVEKGLMPKFKDYGINKVYVNGILDLPFPLIPLQKSFIMNKYSSDEYNHLFWFDIDTIFMRKDDEYWDRFGKVLDENVVVSTHPHYGNNFSNRQILIEKNPLSEAFIPTVNFGRIMSSFWGGRRDLVVSLNKRINQMFANDLKNLRYLPMFVDENYIDKVIWEEEHKDTPDIPIKHDDILIALPSYAFYDHTNDPFLIQKYDIRIKELKKQAIYVK